MVDIDELERLLAAATPGEWVQPFDNSATVDSSNGHTLIYDEGGFTQYDAALIVALHNSAPAMLTEIRELRAENARLRGKVSDALAFLRSAPLESGYCCCGSPVDGHSIGDGHAPVDDLAYYASNLASDLSAALGEPQ